MSTENLSKNEFGDLEGIGSFTNQPAAWMQTFTQEYQGVRETKRAVNIERVGINDEPLYSAGYVRQLEAENKALKYVSLSNDEVTKLLRDADEEYVEFVKDSHGYGWCPTWNEWIVHVVLLKVNAKRNAPTE